MLDNAEAERGPCGKLTEPETNEVRGFICSLLFPLLALTNLLPAEPSSAPVAEQANVVPGAAPEPPPNVLPFAPIRGPAA